jgi:hypothetical protein
MFEDNSRPMNLERIRAKIAEADADPRPSLTEAEMDRHFEERLNRSLAIYTESPKS